MVLGQRADAKALLDPSSKCTIEAIFEIQDKFLEVYFLEKDLDFDNECILRREILPSGKSRAFINDTPVTLDVLKGLAENLVDIHSQHDSLKINHEDFQIGILDVLGENSELLEKYSDRFFSLKDLRSEIASLQERISQAQNEFDFNQFQLEELKAIQIISGEEEQLEKDLKREENLEMIRESITKCLAVFQDPERPMLDMLFELNASLENIKDFSTELEEIHQRMNLMVQEFKEIERDIEFAGQGLELDPTKLKDLRERHDEIYRLLKKHQCTDTEELLVKMEDLERQTSGVQDMEDQLESLKQREKNLEAECWAIAEDLSKKRKEVATKLEERMGPILNDLGMPSATLRVEFPGSELNQRGLDRVIFLFSANKGMEARPVKETASGGEMSRLMLAFKFILGGKSKFPTMIFDEIDTGVSGEIAIQMGKMIQKISEVHQVICITHLPQVAAKGLKHYKVQKDEEGESATTNLQELGEKERINEIAEMIGGKNLTENSLNSAIELLNPNN